ncbi:MAG: alpha/beta fold hydrolase [Candidatus Eisenbacteria bacterium]
MGRLGAALRIALLLALIGAGAAGWYYSGQILGPDAPPTLDEVDVIAATDTSVTLTPDPNGDVLASGVFALEWPGGFGEMTDLVAAESAKTDVIADDSLRPGRTGGDPARITRRFRSIVGRPPVGGRASGRPFAFAADPKTMLGLPFETVAIETPAGSCPAWVMRPANSGAAPDGAVLSSLATGSAAPDSAWMIFVHGRGAVRAQALRVTPLFLNRGWNVLAISYRNDEGAARSDDGRYRLGVTEWHDLEAAVQWAVGHGARRIVITGYSMGGSIVLQFLWRSALASRVEGVLLDGPALRWRPVFDLAARERGVHPILTSLGMFVAAVRAGIRWEDLDLIAQAHEFRVPMLVFHGTADPTVPPALSESLALRRPDLVTLVRVIGAGHVRCWNVDPDGYEAVIASWLGRLGTR